MYGLALESDIIEGILTTMGGGVVNLHVVSSASSRQAKLIDNTRTTWQTFTQIQITTLTELMETNPPASRPTGEVARLLRWSSSETLARISLKHHGAKYPKA